DATARACSDTSSLSRTIGAPPNGGSSTTARYTCARVSPVARCSRSRSIHVTKRFSTRCSPNVSPPGGSWRSLMSTQEGDSQFDLRIVTVDVCVGRDSAHRVEAQTCVVEVRRHGVIRGRYGRGLVVRL